MLSISKIMNEIIETTQLVCHSIPVRCAAWSRLSFNLISQWPCIFRVRYRNFSFHYQYPQCLYISTSVHCVVIHCCLGNNLSQRRPLHSMKCFGRRRLGAFSRKLIGRKKRMMPTFEIHTAQNLEMDDAFEQFLHQTEWKIMQAKCTSEETLGDCLTKIESH